MKSEKQECPVCGETKNVRNTESNKYLCNECSTEFNVLEEGENK